MIRSTRTKQRCVYQLKIALRGVRPPVWRRVLVTSETSLTDMHGIIQAVMGWAGYHMHQFIIDGEYYGQPHDDYALMGMDMADEEEYCLADFGLREGRKLTYEYDFGDSWRHVISVEKALPVDPEAQYPVCLKGKRACPPEDCGGVWGYAGFLEETQDPDHDEHDDMLEWVGGEFDPEEFDLDQTNSRLR